MRAIIVAWLDKHNAKLGPNYGVEKLVWCEEGTSARSSGGIVRGWFRIDTTDRNRRKVVPNASAAIDAMQNFTNTDFYDDIKDHTSHYNIVFTEQPGKAHGSDGQASTSSVDLATIPTVTI